ncbi:hypothetical protein SAMN05421827_1472, partial [Pedobacter terrae]
MLKSHSEHLLDLLKKASANGLSISIDKHKELKVQKVKGLSFDTALIEEIKLYKNELIDFLDTGISEERMITPGIRTGRIPLSYSQESLWVIDKVWGSLQY